MKNLLNKNSLTKEEYEKLDYYFEDNIEELAKLNNDEIIRFIDNCIEIVGISFSRIKLDYYLSNETSDAIYFFEEEKLDYYNKLIELCNYFEFHDYGLRYSIGDYFYNKGDSDTALKYYENVFKNGFDLCDDNYYYSLKNYLRLLKVNPSEKLKNLIKSSPKNNRYSLDFTNTYLLLIINLEKYSDEYIFYIEEAIKVTTIVVRNYQSNNQNRNSISDTDEERNLCELLCLKFEYYVENKNYIKAFELYNELTLEIVKSDCMRYYHARDKIYYEMLKNMSKTYSKLKFFDYIGYAKFLVKDNSSIELDDIITLEKDDGLQFEFKIVNIEDDNVNIVPLLPIIGEGAKIFTKLEKEDNKLYLVNRLSR